MSFGFISVAVGIFGTHVAVGQTLIALVIAQFGARVPLSGSSYPPGQRHQLAGRLILRDQLGVVMERSLLVAIVFASFSAGLLTLGH